jgi:hypothetical protein
MKPRGRIFICYRREGGAEMARLVHDNLRERGFDVFMDVEDLKSGPFNKALLREIELATDVVVILSPGSLDRCFDEGDWLRWEIVHAITCEKNVVLLVTRGFTWPSHPLPEGLKELPYYQGVEPSHNLFGASMDKLVSLLQGRRSLFSRKYRPAFVVALAFTAILAAWFFGQQHGKSPEENVIEKPDRHGWIQLFDGETLSGWTAPDGGNWVMQKGVLTSQGKWSHLFSPYIYTNLEFKSEIKLNHGGKGGMHFRTTLGKGAPAGYEAHLNNTGSQSHRTGSLFEGVRNVYSFQKQVVPDGTWWTNHIVAIGSRIIVKVNKQIVADYVDPDNMYNAGYLALQQYEINGSVVKFRNTKVKRLPSDEKEAWIIARKDIPDIKP